MPNASMSLEIHPINAREDNIFGYGINCMTGRTAGPICVENIVKLNPQPRGDDIFQVKVVKSSSDLSSFLKASASVSASGVSWSATASMSYASDNASSDTSMSYVALRDIRFADVYLDITRATIKADAIALLKGPNGPAAFIDTYGSHCVIGVSYGASFTGYIRMDTHSATQKEAISAAMSASVSAFGNKASVNADFATGRSQITSDYTLTANSSMTGATASTFDRSDPDGLLSAARNISPMDNPNANVKGAPIAFICATWDQFADIQTALNDIGQPKALSLGAAMDTLSKLSAEYTALGYVIGTCDTMLGNGGDFAIPAQNGLTDRLRTGAIAGQNAITNLSLSDLRTMSAATLQSLQISSQLNVHLRALTRRSLLIKAAWYTDDAFVDPGEHSQTIIVPMDTMPRVTQVDHHGWQPNLYLHVGSDDGGYYLVTRWDNRDSNFDSPRINIGGDGINTTIARAEWQGANWNNISANLVNYP